MPIKKYRSSTIMPLSALIPEIAYVMCGARGETSNRLMRALPQMKFFGFEPDEEEYRRLSTSAAKGFTYFHAAVGGRDERRTLYVTRNPACSSLLRPNLTLYGRFKDCAPDLQVIEEKPIDVVSLDSFLLSAGVNVVDFLDLDTQGSELEILQGAQRFLSDSVLVLKCEVEFSPLYEGQPLFGEVDRFLQRFGFMLFDLSRSRYRRADFPAHALTRGQLLWGDALYLRDHAWFAARGERMPLFKLALLAAHLGFHDYALEAIDVLLAGGAGRLSVHESEGLAKAREQYLRDLKSGEAWVGLLYGLETMGLRRPVKLVGRLAGQLSDRLRRDRTMTEYNWVD